MASRAARKLLKAQEEDEKAQILESEEEDLPSKGKKPLNFAALAHSDSDSEPSPHHRQASPVSHPQEEKKLPVVENPKKKKKKKKAKAKKISEDEFDSAIKEYLVPLQNQQSQEPQEEEEEKSSSTLSLNAKSFNYTKELQRYFKDSVPKEKSKGPKFKPKKRLILVSNTDSLFPLAHELQCKEIGVNGMSEKEFAFFASSKYEALQDTYEGLKNMHDLQNVFDFLSLNPGHIEALYDVSEYFRLKGDYAQANNLLERILYVYESSFSPEFSTILHKEKMFTLDFNSKYDKLFFFALHRFAGILGKKSCFKAANEYNKLLLRISPMDDPMGALLCFDYYAISARYYSYFVNFAEKFAEEIYKNSEVSIAILPNISYSLALSKFLQKIEDKADLKEIVSLDIDVEQIMATAASDLNSFIRESDASSVLVYALVCHPYFMLEIAKANDYLTHDTSHSLLNSLKPPSFSEIFSSGFFKLINLFQENTEIHEKLAEFYTEKSKILWKQNEVKVFVKAISFIVLKQLSESESCKEKIAKHLDILEKKLPFPLSRYSSLSRKHFSDTEAMDFGAIEDNVTPNQQRNPINTNQNMLNLLLGSLMPWNDIPS